MFNIKNYTINDIKIHDLNIRSIRYIFRTYTTEIREYHELSKIILKLNNSDLLSDLLNVTYLSGGFSKIYITEKLIRFDKYGVLFVELYIPDSLVKINKCDLSKYSTEININIGPVSISQASMLAFSCDIDDNNNLTGAIFLEFSNWLLYFRDEKNSNGWNINLCLTNKLPGQCPFEFKVALIWDYAVLFYYARSNDVYVVVSDYTFKYTDIQYLRLVSNLTDI